MNKKFAVCALLALSLAGCSNDGAEVDNSCFLNSFMDYCDEDKFVYCGGEGVYTLEKGIITEFDCVNNGFGSCVNHPILSHYSADCENEFLCNEAGKLYDQPKCGITHYNHPGMYSRICVDDELGRHWTAYHRDNWHEDVKTEDCNGACIPGSNKCYLEGETCNSGSTIGCHGNDLYFCDQQLGKGTVRVHHCKSDELCVQVDASGEYESPHCAKKCTTPDETNYLCMYDSHLWRMVCTETEMGNYYLETPDSSHIHNSQVCYDDQVNVVFSEDYCDPAVDHSSCVNNYALNCRNILSDQSTTKLSTYNCWMSNDLNVHYGLCQMISDQAICLNMCSEKGAKRTTYELGGFWQVYRMESIVTYECREIDGNLYDYPIEIKECPNGFNDSRTDCK